MNTLTKIGWNGKLSVGSQSDWTNAGLFILIGLGIWSSTLSQEFEATKGQKKNNQEMGHQVVSIAVVKNNIPVILFPTF